MRHFSDDERRARLARRHALAPTYRVASVEAATRAMTVLHSTEPATVYLSCQARVDGLRIEDVDRALYRDRSVVKQLAMRRTLFVFPRDLLPAAWGSASARVAGTERARIAKDCAAAGVHPDGDAWLDEARAEVLAVLGEHPEGLQAAELRERVPMIDVKVTVGGALLSATRVITHLGATADVVRAVNTGHWRVSRPRWTLMSGWIAPGEPVGPPLEAADGWAELVRRWLHTFGPGTETDIVWWLGATKGIVRAALAALAAVEVSLDGGSTGWVLPDDVEPVGPVEPVEPWVALLPVLDPTVMGWKERDWYLGPHAPALFDSNGNAGTTVWAGGRVVGTWVQDDAGAVVVHLLEPQPRTVVRSLDAEAARLTAWLDGTRVGTVYPSPAMKAARATLLA